jgi:hypothetical protein
MSTVGHAHRLVGSPSTPDLAGASISFAYVGSEVPVGQEEWIKLYYQAELSTTWHMLPTQLDTYHNTASAPAQGEGLYVLMTSIEIPLYSAGWNLAAYPVQGTRPVAEALQSISGTYSTVYGYEGQDAEDPWKVYAVNVPAWVNDLKLLEFGRGYWISVTHPITLHLRGPSDGSWRANTALPLPPATYYGAVLPAGDLLPLVGMTLTAWIDGNLCGQTVLSETTSHGLAYAVNVEADDWGPYAGCGAPGREVVFKLVSQELTPIVVWNNDRVYEQTLTPWRKLYLPLLMRASALPRTGADIPRAMLLAE